jgi:putative membrane protein
MILARRWRLPDVMHYVGLPLVALFAWDVVVAGVYVGLGQRWIAVTDLPMSLIGSGLAILLTFRNNTAYARWWEARQLLGAVVNSSRTLARQARLFLPDGAAGSALVRLQIAYAHALRCHLRRQAPWAEIGAFVPADLRERLHGIANLPETLLREIADRLAALHRDGALDSIALAAFDGTLAALGAAQGGAERLKNTPLPLQYTLFPRIFVEVFCVLLPLAMVTDLGLLTPLGSTLVGCILLALDQVGRDLENPFENTVYDVPLTAITRGIEIDLRQGLGDTDVPPPLAPVDGALW